MEDISVTIRLRYEIVNSRPSRTSDIGVYVNYQLFPWECNWVVLTYAFISPFLVELSHETLAYYTHYSNNSNTNFECVILFYSQEPLTLDFQFLSCIFKKAPNWILNFYEKKEREIISHEFQMTVFKIFYPWKRENIFELKYKGQK